MRGRQLLGSQRLKCAASTLNYFPNEVFSFPLNLVCSFRGQNVLKEGEFVTPVPMRCTVHVTVRVHMCTKCHCKG